MFNTIRSITSFTRTLSHRTTPTFSIKSVRSFHSPFVVLNSSASPLTSTPSPALCIFSVYEKQHDHSPDPKITYSGTRTYVVSEPDPAHTPYTVPSGAYPTSAPYLNYAPAEDPRTIGTSSGSTSSQLVHPYTTRAAPQNPAGVGYSAAIRNSQAPGEMKKKGGSYGGLSMMNATSVEGE